MLASRDGYFQLPFCRLTRGRVRLFYITEYTRCDCDIYIYAVRSFSLPTFVVYEAEDIDRCYVRPARALVVFVAELRPSKFDGEIGQSLTLIAGRRQVDRYDV